MGIEHIGAFQVFLGAIARFWPAWLALAIVLGASFAFKKKLGLYGQLFDSGVGIAGVTICFFWLFTAIFAGTIAPFDPLGQVPIMKDALPGAIEPASQKIYLFGGDKLARDVFSRMVFGSQIVLITPLPAAYLRPPSVHQARDALSVAANQDRALVQRRVIWESGITVCGLLRLQLILQPRDTESLLLAQRRELLPHGFPIRVLHQRNVSIAQQRIGDGLALLIQPYIAVYPYRHIVGKDKCRKDFRAPSPPSGGGWKNTAFPQTMNGRFPGSGTYPQMGVLNLSGRPFLQAEPFLSGRNFLETPPAPLSRV